LDSCRWFTIRLTLHSFSLSRGCVSSRPGFEPPMSRGTGTCRSVLRHVCDLSVGEVARSRRDAWRELHGRVVYNFTRPP
jgi:hypothetical protein